MSIKKILAAATASVLAVSAMAVVASAGEMTSSIPFKDDGSGNYQFIIIGEKPVTETEGLDVTKISAIDITLTFETESGAVDEDGNPIVPWAGGSIVLQSDSLGWKELGQWENAVGNNKAFEGVESGKPFRIELGENRFAADEGYAIITMQSYGVTPNVEAISLYAEDGSTLFGMDKDGVTTPVAAAPADESTPEESTPEESTPEESTPAESTPDASGDDDKTNTDTGVEGVAAVLGVAVVAGGALVVAKKRK